MLKKQILILLIISLIPNSSCFIDDLWKAVKGIWKFVLMMNNIQETTNTGKAIYELFTGEDDNYQLLTEQLNEIVRELHEMRYYTEFKLNVIEKLLVYLPDEMTIRDKQKEVGLFIAEVDRKYDEFLEYMQKPIATVEVLNDFTLILLFHAKEVLHHIRNIITPPDKIRTLDNGLLHSIAERAANRIDVQCGSGQTVQYFLINLYTMLMKTEIKVHVMLTFTYMYRYAKNNGWQSQMKRLKVNIQEQFVRYLYTFSNSLEAIDSSYLRSCDPAFGYWVRDESFYELDGFLQEVIFKYRAGNCIYDSCYSIWHSKRYECEAQWFDNRTKCAGQVLSCAWLGDVEACALREGPHKYQWVRSTQKGVQGRDYDSCPNDKGYMLATSDPNAPILYSNCLCHCFEGKWIIHLAPMKSRIESNYVITGLRFKRNDHHMLFLQPAEGKLEANGYISNSSWIPLPRVINEENTRRVDLVYRSVFLDDLRLPSGYALTGAQFIAVARGKGIQVTGFSIQIIGVPFDYRTGQLDLLPGHKVILRASESNVETELPIKPVNSIDKNPYNDRHEPNPRIYTHVKLQQSEINDDFGQSTLPLIDSIPVETYPPSPLGGIGIFHKGFNGYAGFISLRLYPIDYLYYAKKFIERYEMNATAVWDD